MSFAHSLLSAAQLGLAVGVGVVVACLLCYTLFTTLSYVYVRISRPIGDYLVSLASRAPHPGEARELGLLVATFFQGGAILLELILMFRRWDNERITEEIKFSSWDVWATLPRELGQWLARAIVEAVVVVSVLSGVVQVRMWWR